MDILSTNAQREVFAQLGLQLPTSSVADEFRERTRQNGIDSLYFFTTAVLGWKKVQVNPHLALCQFIQQTPPEFPDRKRRKVVLVPRDCYKSTVGSKSLPLWILIQPNFCGLPGLEHRILLASHSSDNAKKQIKSLRQQIERNTILAWLYPEVVPDISHTTWTDTNLLFPREGVYGEDTIEAAGVDTHLVSRHYTIQIKDDIEDEQAMLSPTVRERVKNWYRAAEALFVDERDAYDLLIGTRWGADDVYADIKKNETEAYEFLVRPLYWTAEMLTRDYREAAERKEPPTYDMPPAIFAPDETETYYFFPALFPPDSIRRIQAKQGSFMFSMLYMNDPKDPALAEFHENDLRYFDFDDNGDLVLDEPGGLREHVPYESLRVVMFWDPALSERETKRNCRNAIVVAGKDPKGRLFAIDAYAEYKNAAFLYTKFIGMHQRWRVGKAAIEDAAFQRILKFPLYHTMRELNVHFPVEELRPIGDKDARIRSLIPYSESRMLYVRRGLRNLIDELKSFPVGQTKDIIDAFAACLSMTGLQAVRSKQATRSAARHEASRLQTRNIATGY
jgi:predicted phage terminase large subunit-like protein